MTNKYLLMIAVAFLMICGATLSTPFVVRAESGSTSTENEIDDSGEDSEDDLDDSDEDEDSDDDSDEDEDEDDLDDRSGRDSLRDRANELRENREENRVFRNNLMEERKDIRAERMDDVKDLRSERREDFKNASSSMEKKGIMRAMRADMAKIRAQALIRQLSLTIEKMIDIKDRIAERIVVAEESGRDMSDAKEALDAAEVKIDDAKDAIDELASWSPATTTATSTGEVSIEKPRELLKDAIDALKDARDALKDVVRSIAHNMGLGDGNDDDSDEDEDGDDDSDEDEDEDEDDDNATSTDDNSTSTQN